MAATKSNTADEDQYLSSYYGEDIFDDLIEKALHPTSSDHNDVDEEHLLEKDVQLIGYDNEAEEEDLVDTTPAIEENIVDDDASVDLEDLEEGGGIGSDASSLDSKEISGGSILSDVDVDVREMESYSPAPLINDDESTIDMRPPAPQMQTVSSFVEQLNRREKNKSKLFKGGACALCIAIIVGAVLAVVTLTGGNDDNSSQSSSKELTTGSSTSSSPTMSPSVNSTSIETIHPVQMTFQNVPAGYRLPTEDVESLVSFTTELLGDYVEDPYELIEVANARDGNENNPFSTLLSRQLSDATVPLRIVISGPSNVSEDTVQLYIIDVLYDQSNTVIQFMKQLDWDNFNAVSGVSFDEYDIMDLVEPTLSPSLPPQTEVPTETLLLETEEPTATETNVPTPSPSLNSVPPTNNPSEQLSIITTPIPTLRPSVAKLPTSKPMSSDNSGSTPSVPAPSSSGTGPVSSSDYFCAKTSYTESWNILMDFNCELPCPSGVLDCPGGHQCQISDYCSSIQG